MSDHIEVRHHYIQEKVLDQEIDQNRISTGDQVIDIFIKVLVKVMFESFRATLRVLVHKHALSESVKK